jgi:hypothetical protein
VTTHIATDLKANLAGSGWMIASMAVFAIEDAFIKAASVTLPVGQVLVIFGLGGSLVFASLALYNREPLYNEDVISRPMWIRVVFEIIGREQQHDGEREARRDTIACNAPSPPPSSSAMATSALEGAPEHALRHRRVDLAAGGDRVDHQRAGVRRGDEEHDHQNDADEGRDRRPAAAPSASRTASAPAAHLLHGLP